tara:strand:+ start:764 stop:1384 length:621 start_codon:yes stop_codon:yes gene_type:complete
MSFINTYGGNKDTMRHSGLKAVKNAIAAGLTINQIREQASREGISFGSGAQQYLNARPANTFIAQYGGNEDTFANSGMQAVSKAMASGLSPAQIDQMARSEGVSFGINARNFLDNDRRQKEEQASIRARYDQQMKGIQTQLAQQQQMYQDNVAQMRFSLQAANNPSFRQSTLGVRAASDVSRNKGRRNKMNQTFSRGGLRISSLNL